MDNGLLNIKLENDNTIRSVDLAEIINHFRKVEGREKLRHYHFMRKIRNDGIPFKLIEYKDKKGEKRLCYALNKEAVKHTADMTKSRDKEVLLKVYEYMGGDSCVVYCIDRFETTFFNKLSDTLQAMDIELDTQKNVLDKYRLDGFLPQYNIAIEYDEEQHNVEPQKSKDIKRQKEIEDKFGYKFIRLNYKDTDAYNVGLVIKELIKYIVERKN